ncbi:hypothetical protein ACTJK6_21635 [Ralstonia sp. 22086]|uniref:hypothetical protein n=1 Tax=Ralstonia sp. 22086 TaxID=3453870 RepID=UPI003F863DC8
MAPFVAVLLALLRVVLPVPAALVIDGLAVDVPALDGALNFCCREEKEGRLFERSEFASPPSLRHKFKESFAISGAPFFAYFLWQDKESESAPAGDETRDEPQTSINPSPQSNISQ